MNTKITKPQITRPEVFPELAYLENMVKIQNEKGMSFITTGVPSYGNNQPVSAYDHVMTEPNGVATDTLFMSSGGGFISPGNDIKIYSVTHGTVFGLIPNGSGPLGTGSWYAGYFPDAIYESINPFSSSVEWSKKTRDAGSIEVLDANGVPQFNYNLGAGLITFLYETPNEKYACLLFDFDVVLNQDVGFFTGYVPMESAMFYRYQTEMNPPYQDQRGSVGRYATDLIKSK